MVRWVDQQIAPTATDAPRTGCPGRGGPLTRPMDDRACPSRQPNAALIYEVFSWYDDPASIGLRCLSMPPVGSALLALVSSLVRSRGALHLQVLAVPHQVAVSQQTIRRLRLSPSDRVCWSWRSRLWAGWHDV